MKLPQPFIHLEKEIGIHFKNKDTLVRALTHRSAARESREHGHNERLEFLGDAVLELVSSEFLFQFKEKDEGELTNMRAALVQGEHLARVAKECKLGDYLNMSNGEEASGGREKHSTLANAVEALIGAIFMDQGYDAAKDFCSKYILSNLPQLIAEGKTKDEKSHFQEKAQETMSITPHYEVLSESGPDHDKKFVCGLFLEEEKISEGSGTSKQRAEQDAAKNGLKVKGWK